MPVTLHMNEGVVVLAAVAAHILELDVVAVEILYYAYGLALVIDVLIDLRRYLRLRVSMPATLVRQYRDLLIV